MAIAPQASSKKGFSKNPGKIHDVIENKGGENLSFSPATILLKISKL